MDCIRRSVDFRITSKDEGGPFQYSLQDNGREINMTNTLEKKVSYEIKLNNGEIIGAIRSMGCVLDRLYNLKQTEEMTPVTSRYNAKAPGSVKEQAKAYALA